MATVTWNSPAADWNSGVNWSPAQTPAARDTAVLNSGTAELLSGIDPANTVTLDFGGPAVTDPNNTANVISTVGLQTLNVSFGAGFNIVETSTFGNGGTTEAVLAAGGITAYSGVIAVGGANTALVIEIGGSSSVVKAAPRADAPAFSAAISNPSGIGQFQNLGTINVSAGGLVLLAPLASGDAGKVSMLAGTVNLNAGTLAAVSVTLGPPSGGIGTNGAINLANASTLIASKISNVAVNFSDAAGNLVVFSSTQNGAVISGFRSGDTIEQTPQSIFGVNTPYGNNGLTYNTATHVLQVTTGVGGTPFLTYNIAGSYTASQFRAVDDANGNLLITLACFAAGTRIATPRGEVAVEALAVGEAVCTAGGAARPAIWIGHRRIDVRTHPDPASVRPVRIRAGAFDGRRPWRDLLLSPDHAVFHDGVLIPVRYLVNGATVVWDQSVDTITYYHIELAAHDVLLAEGLPVESYLDTGNRSQFGDAGLVVQLHPDFSTGRVLNWDKHGFAPLRGAGPQVAALRRLLHAQAASRGFSVARAPALRLRVDGREIPPLLATGGVFRFALRWPDSDVGVISAYGVPAEVDPGSDDWRRLGVMVEQIVLWRGSRRGELTPDALAEGRGWHAAEAAAGTRWCWTDGAAVLASRMFPRGERMAFADIHLAGAQARWRPPAEHRRLAWVGECRR